MKLVFATNNAHKLEEVQAVVGPDIEILSLTDIQCAEDIPETGTTFEANALQKSQYLLDNYHLDCFADDSGLEVEALNNEPGVYSARYSGSRDMERNIALLLEKLGSHKNRKARFRTVISLQLAGESYFFSGTINGTITYDKKGDQGFGYDPIFIPDGYDKTFAEMDASEKNAISHRSLAVAEMVAFLKSIQG